MATESAARVMITLEPSGFGLHYTRYVVRGGKYDGWYVCKRWMDDGIANFTAPIPECPTSLKMQTYRFTQETLDVALGCCD